MHVIRSFTIVGVLLFAGLACADQVVPQKARLAMPSPNPPAPPSKCRVTANPNPVGVDDDVSNVGGRTFSVTGKGRPTSLCVKLLIPADLNYETTIVGPGLNHTLPAKGGCVASPYGPYGAQSYAFVATVKGVGGNGTCAVTVGTTCSNHISYLEGIWAVSYATFGWDDATFIANYDPPFCTWTWAGHGNRGSDPGCFAPSTRMLMADGKLRRADKVQKGDWLYTANSGAPVRVKKVIWGPEKDPFVELRYPGHRLLITQKHPVPTRRGMLQGREVRVGDWVQSIDGRLHRLTGRRDVPAPENGLVYNFELDLPATASENDHWIVAEGTMVGDYELQVRGEHANKVMAEGGR